ncbi:hypothetical protein L6164_026369 [Bauhinia variegata]|uniref:Uncharacterized protein n=1 Tax=Bauhinia variegata TaxID=167791 RepID=A0ACB9LPI7_BAUVA|nr:hypothetical protein L6164_026369 [Bauhinia variegata]
MATFFYYSILYLIILLTFKLFFQTRTFRKLPPGPLCLPIIGNLYILHHLREPLHHIFHRLSCKYGQIFSLWFGHHFFVVVSSLPLVNECFSKNDIVLANRPQFLSGKYIGYNYTTISTSSYGDHWRNLRRIVTVEILSTHRLNSFTAIRTDEAKMLIKKLARDSRKGKGTFAKVEFRSKFLGLTFNIITRMVTGKRYYDDGCDILNGKEEGKEFIKLISELVKLGATSNPSDFLPILRCFDFGDLEKNLQRISRRTDALLQELIDEHRNGKESKNTMIDHLLTLQQSQPDYYTDQIIKGLISIMFNAGTETSAVTLEWAMSELLNHPKVLKKVREELDAHIGQDRLVEEQDVSRLPYLQSVIFETLRLHPAVPMLIPHMSSDHCTIGGYNIPKNTVVSVNAWAIQRDPRVWSEPMNFRPERFEKDGETNKLVLFGVGRRACPGVGLAQRTLGLTLASLIQCFEWARINDEEIDMTEGRGASMPKEMPLEAMCKERPIIKKVFSESC